MDPLTAIRDFRALSERVGTAGQPTAEQFAAIRAAGYDAVVNLALPTSTGALPDEAAIAAAHGLDYTHLPVEWQTPSTDDLLRFFQTMDERRERKVFVHCAMNMRVSAFMYLYRLRAGEAEAVAAADLYAVWQPEGVWGELLDAWRAAFARCATREERERCRPSAPAAP